jgi:hypothetical protein
MTHGQKNIKLRSDLFSSRHCAFDEVAVTDARGIAQLGGRTTAIVSTSFIYFKFPST